jgi:N-succinyldiaminopimelate aminotransferase
VPAGTYFVSADASGLGYDDATELCRRLPELAGVVAVPVPAFCTPGSPTSRALGSWVRFTYVKQRDVLEEGMRRLVKAFGQG